MKTISSALYAVLLRNRAPAFLAHWSWLKKYGSAILFIFFFLLQHLSAQDILIKNPSLEGVRGQVKAPPSWLIAFNTPDIQPGVLGIDLPASHGATYVGLHSGKDVLEGIAQEIFLKGQRRYTFSFDLAYAPLYIFRACYGDLAIYGSDSATVATDLLWSSGKFYHTDWKRYTAEFKTTRSYRYIILVAAISGDCDKSQYGCAVLIDNLSATMQEMPQITFNVEHTCVGAANGHLSANVSGVTPPYTYLWKPGGQTTSSIANLDVGTYEVTVTAANGTQATASTVIRNTDLKSDVSTITSDCNGENKNQILINTTGGIPPYQYYLNKNDHASYTPVFKDLRPGSYQVKVKDEHGCLNNLQNIKLEEPLPLELTAVNATGTTCTSTMDGKIELNVGGGTAPYAYRLETKEWQTDHILSKLDAGNYYYQVKDKNNCQVNGSAVIIRNIRECAIFVPTAFSPNGDGNNDLFRVKLHDDVHDFHLDVYSRWGQMVFSTTNPEGAWDGGQQPIGSYVWVLVYTDSKQQARKQTGYLMLVK